MKRWTKTYAPKLDSLEDENARKLATELLKHPASAFTVDELWLIMQVKKWTVHFTPTRRLEIKALAKRVGVAA